MKRKQKFCIILIAIFILLGLKENVFADSVVESGNDLTNVVVQMNNSVMPFEINSKKSKNYFLSKFNRFIDKLGATLPSSYRTENLVVKDQGTTGECWAFSFTSAFEAYNLRKFGSTDIYSPKHIDYSCSKSFTDVTDTKNLFNRETSENVGNDLMAVAYSASGKGPVLEKDMPFDNNTTRKISYKELDKKVKKRLDTSILFDSIYKKIENENIKYYSDSKFSDELTLDEVDDFRKKIKVQIINNGGVITSLYQRNMGDKDVCVTNSDLKCNHSILIVGWDDNYQASGWKNKGAYVGMNSYGTGNFYDGYVYVSYDDLLIEQSMMGIAKTSDIDFDNVYEYDPFGATASIYASSLEKDDSQDFDATEISAVNVFSRNNSKQEMLNEVGISTFCYEMAEVYFSDTFNEETGLPINFRKVANLTSTLSPGFSVIDLDEEVLLDKDKFAICVRFIEDNEENKASVAIEYRLGHKWWDNIDGEKGETYFVDKFDPSGENKYWSLYYEAGNDEKRIYKNASIKAYTTDVKTAGEFDITSSDYRVVKNEKMITRIANKTDIDDFKSKINANAEYEIIDRDGNVMTEGIIKTGDRIRSGDEEYVISVIGDISGDGKVNILDLSRMRLYLIGKLSLVGTLWQSADLNGNNKVDIIDLSIMRIECLK